MPITLYSIVAFLCIGMIILGIRLMNSPKYAVQGNLLGAFGVLCVILLTLSDGKLLSFPVLWIAMFVGLLLGVFLAEKVKMTQMPQLVALLNGFGGGASAIIALVVLTTTNDIGKATLLTGNLALIIGAITFSGSVIAGAKLSNTMRQTPVILRGHSLLLLFLLLILFALVGLEYTAGMNVVGGSTLLLVVALFLGCVFTLRIGGADMPITISLLNSLSGIAAAVTGFAVSNILLVAIGGIVGSAGIILTRVMCRAMNRDLNKILTGKTILLRGGYAQEFSAVKNNAILLNAASEAPNSKKVISILENSCSIVIIPGYGMALSQAQRQVKILYEKLEAMGKNVKFAIHPVAGRMPGHMNVLLAEVGIPYGKLYEMDNINPEFQRTDAVIVVGANDVVNPAAKDAVGTPIYGMPVLNIDESKHIIIFNKDTKPGYAGVDNPLYHDQEKVILVLGDAAEKMEKLARQFH